MSHRLDFLSIMIQIISKHTCSLQGQRQAQAQARREQQPFPGQGPERSVRPERSVGGRELSAPGTVRRPGVKGERWCRACFFGCHPIHRRIQHGNDRVARCGQFITGPACQCIRPETASPSSQHLSSRLPPSQLHTARRWRLRRRRTTSFPTSTSPRFGTENALVPPSQFHAGKRSARDSHQHAPGSTTRV